MSQSIRRLRLALPASLIALGAGTALAVPAQAASSWSPPGRAYPVTRPGLLMAQATLPGLLSVLRPVVVPARNYLSHPPHPAL